MKLNFHFKQCGLHLL